ncbi:hypothetical protein HBH56_127550 [Parastagonospora nodorum]|uniref:Uncharacterized protein n=1 Tax=Phaeosphaeria nodorum (strain SN15 / ATCC MYA-4574 / FGSC 10173) TaxID=321614 RepID=A0A7U2I9I5_PHANO|nr:hypothetical protein HBH56_127550 [Parastagonospora nodorum]QRD05736.1 hypothetical protein JI435_444820 [Parastagonospora nodorum SN15]KAH3931453.1 hypothetical protein HBH54_095950 [Parastagonospora nodorum]KAH3947301.1 hypothetical protein HBH53_117840 [Parastagonospora nodorum]KAH3970701.1 hypothetical protein HBH51_114260 [Parastagonospora nodorum]
MRGPLLCCWRCAAVKSKAILDVQMQPMNVTNGSLVRDTNSEGRGSRRPASISGYAWTPDFAECFPLHVLGREMYPLQSSGGLLAYNPRDWITFPTMSTVWDCGFAEDLDVWTHVARPGS